MTTTGAIVTAIGPAVEALKGLVGGLPHDLPAAVFIVTRAPTHPCARTL